MRLPFFNFKKNKKKVREIDYLFSYLASVSHNPDAIENYLYRFNKLKRKYKVGNEKIFIELYLDWESFIVSNRPTNRTRYTKDSLREAVRKEINISKLEKEIKIIFLPKREQAIALYEYFIDKLSIYIVNNIGEEKLIKTLKNLQQDPLLAKIRLSGENINFELINNIIIQNNIEYPLDEITDSFRHLAGSLYNIIELSLGGKVTKSLFNKIFVELKETYNTEIVSSILKIVPERVLDFGDWVSLMSKQELEAQVLEQTSELEALTTSLEAKVKKRTEELQRAYQDLKILDEKKSEFISVAAHQLRTPLSALKWSMAMIKDGDLGPVTKEQENFLNKGLETNDRIISIINDLLDIDLLVKKKVSYKIEPIDIVPIIETAIGDLEPQAKRKGIRFIRPQLPEGMKIIAEVDSAKISVVIQNLIDNAIKYCKEGDTITINLMRVNTVVNISVKDTGIGIPKKVQEDIFKRFFRAENAVRKVTEGSGIGLFITKSIVEDHGGRIWFESEENKGTTFYITLPIFRDASNQGLNNPIAKKV